MIIGNLNSFSRFNRNLVPSGRVTSIKYYNRDFLPTIFWLDGDVWFSNSQSQFHNTTGPSKIRIDGVIEYILNGKNATVFDIMIIYDNQHNN